jgi:electron transport complex protein RnfG
MKKLKSSLLNMVVVLGATTILAGLLLGLVNAVTTEPRLKAAAEKQQQALTTLLGKFDNNPTEDATSVEVDNQTATIYPATVGGKLTAAAVESTSPNGFSGEIKIMTAFAANGDITGYRVMEQGETPGLGAKMVDWFEGEGQRSIIGRNPSQARLIVSKDGGDVDGITAATISSRAFLEAVNTASKAFKIYVEQTSQEERQ